MLTNETIKIIKSTVPVLEVHGEKITTRFYQLLFQNNPELLNIFNHANQKQGRQQTALANAVYAAAAHIDHLEEIIEDVKLIAHKHRSLGIKPEQYPIVGKNLLAAIKDVLGDAATDEVLNAWKEAYQVIANAFISFEQGLYQQVEEVKGGWRDFRKFVVDKKVKESEVITSYYLKPQDGGPLATFQPGQYISVKVEIPGVKNTHIRQYSLSDSPGKDYYRISVKQESGNDTKPDGLVSTYLHQQIKEGDILEISAPAGVFTLDEQNDRPVVLLSGGVGLTPLTSMVNTLVEKYPERPVTFIHAAINGNFHAFAQHMTELASKNKQLKNYVVYERPTDNDRRFQNFDREGFITIDWLKSILKSNQMDFYFCGPTPFMKAMYKGLKQWGVEKEHIHFEFFGPAGELEEQAETVQAK